MKKIVEIHVDEDDSVVRASIAGLALSAAAYVVERANAEAYKLLETRARLRHFRRPVTVRSFGSSGNLLAKFGPSGCTWGEDSPERGEPGEIVFEDARVRRASVRVEISAKGKPE